VVLYLNSPSWKLLVFTLNWMNSTMVYRKNGCRGHNKPPVQQ
jgi:hypothetical protein